MSPVYKSVGRIEVRGTNNPVAVIALSSLGSMSGILGTLPVVSGCKVSGTGGPNVFQGQPDVGMSDVRLYGAMVDDSVLRAAKSIYSETV